MFLDKKLIRNLPLSPDHSRPLSLSYLSNNSINRHERTVSLTRWPWNDCTYRSMHPLHLPFDLSHRCSRAKIMQEDPFGVYRINTTHKTTNASSNTLLNDTNESGLISPSGWNLSNSEASLVDHYGHPDGVTIGQVFSSRWMDLCACLSSFIVLMLYLYI